MRCAISLHGPLVRSHDKSLCCRMKSPHTRQFSRRSGKCSDLSYGKSSLPQGLLAGAREGINLAECVDLSLTTPFPVSRTARTARRAKIAANSNRCGLSGVIVRESDRANDEASELTRRRFIQFSSLAGTAILTGASILAAPSTRSPRLRRHTARSLNPLIAAVFTIRTRSG
ncbi:twin-arginine translocation signal domain-containing protein [Microbispora hainanensis]|uniref:twin-arginine translocation signal domain-containing protein n=1 Tax=Microbispora hainanensis TaxID=568844 RepID=UPI0033DE66C5